MQIILLGTGGVSSIPRPTCFCDVCQEARKKGIPYSRTGCSLFIKEENILFDTPESIYEQLNREKIKSIEHIFLTHWHPDHTQGIRVIETINWNFSESKPFNKPINVYISDYQFEMFKKYSAGGFLDYYQNKNIINIIKIENKKKFNFKNITINPYLIEKTKGFYFLISNQKKQTVYLPCEYHLVEIDKEIKNVDVFISHNLFWENNKISLRKNPPKDEDSFEKMLKDADQIKAKKIILTHIEESFKLGHDELNEKLKKYYPNYDVTAGYDGQIIKL